MAAAHLNLGLSLRSAGNRVEARKHLQRVLELSPDEKLIREFILQLKLGRVSAASFQNKFGVDVRVRFRDALEKHEKAGFLRIEGEDVVLSRPGLLKVDLLLHDFFLNAHRGVRYS